MNYVWQSLVWKEWREHRWKLAALAALYIAIPATAGLGTPEGFFAAMSMTFTAVAPVASMFVAMGIAAGEQSRGTIHFLQALPTSMVKPGAAKLAMGLVTIIAPVVVAVGVAFLLSWTRLPAFHEAAVALDLNIFGTAWGLNNWFAARALAVALGSASIVLWIAAVGVNRSDEVRAGAIGLLVTMVIWSAVVYLGILFRADGAMPDWWSIVYGIAPGAVAAVGVRLDQAELSAFGRYAWAIAAAALLAHAALAAWYLHRFGRVARARITPAELPRHASVARAWLAPPRSGPLAAIVWKQARESGPLALLGAALIVAAALIFAVHQSWAYGEDVDDVVIIASVTGWAFLGLFVSLVAGIGLFMDEMQPELYAFWRSRPIGVDQWFGIKFLTGACVTLATLAVPPIIVLALAQLAGLRMNDHERMMGELRQFAPTMISAQLELFCMAVMAIILVRQAIYAAVLAIAAAGMVMAACARFELWGDFHLLTATWIAAAAAIIVAWLAVRNDWGWKP